MENVYFFRETGRPYVKIGMARNDIQERFNQFKTYAPLGAYIVGFIKTKDSCKLEKELHKKYNEKRMYGEFFNITDDEVYAEINLHESKFGEIVFFINDLIENHNIDLNFIKYELLKKINKSELNKEKTKPDTILIEFLEKNKGELMTNNQICNELNDLGLFINQYNLGVTLKQLGYKQTRKRVNGISALVYIL